MMAGRGEEGVLRKQDSPGAGGFGSELRTSRPSAAGLVRDVLDMQGARVFVLGDLILDSYIEGGVHRISPEAPVPVVRVSSRRDVLGGAGNVAANIRAMGGQAVLVGRVGRDVSGDRFLRLIETSGVVDGGILVSETAPTTQKTRVLAGSQQVIRLDEESVEPLSADDERLLVAAFERFLVETGVPSAVVLSDYDKGVLTPRLIRAIITRARTAGVPVITDPKKRELLVYSGSTVLKPNRQEALTLPTLLSALEREGADFQNQEIFRILLQESGAENVVLSLSADGIVCGGLLTKGNVVHFPSAVLRVADVSGAGDTVVALLAMGLAAGLGLERATELGNVAAGLVCGKPGTATVAPSELIDGYHLAAPEHSREKILSRETARELSARLKAEGCTIVFTNGCFDLLHPGHVACLSAARRLGHFLFVGLNSDASVRRLKGPDRPVQSEESRAQVLSALACVDFVVVFDEDTPQDLIRMVQPDVLVKGGDYVPEKIVGAEDVKSWGGRVETIPLVPGQSTTGIIERSGSSRDR
jgi:D-beta-D-heptose 7-phosphate kinase/D-beta-D-heptose 1-phosphate adenosyltransferase